MRKMNRRSKDLSNPAVPVAGAGADDVTKLDLENRVRDLQLDNETLKREIEELRGKLSNVTSSSSVGALHSKEDYTSRTKNGQAMSSTKMSASVSASKKSNDEIQKLKAQKVKLQCKIKLDSLQFRLCKASLEKEVLQLKKEQRRSEFEKHVLLALNKRQKQILKLKHSQAFTAAKQLKSLLGTKKTSLDKNNLNKAAGAPKPNNMRMQDSTGELQLMTRFNMVYSQYERQMKETVEEIKKYTLEADTLKEELLQDQNSCSATPGDQVINTPIDSELKELKEEFNKLSNMVSRMEMKKLQMSEPDVFQGKSADSVCIVNSNTQSNIDSSPLETTQPSPEMQCATKQITSHVCCSCTTKSLCKTLKCQCKASGKGCGDSCGCAVSKCTNRKVIHSSVNGKENENCTKGDAKAAEKPYEITSDKETSKIPLCDIGNTKGVKSYAGKVGYMKKEKQVARN